MEPGPPHILLYRYRVLHTSHKQIKPFSLRIFTWPIIQNMKIAYFTFSLMLIVIQNAFGQIGDLKGPYPFDADALQYLSYNLMQNDSIAPVYAGNGFQYIDTYSKMPAVRQKFEMAYPFAGNFGLVKVNGKYGIIDRKGMF